MYEQPSIYIGNLRVDEPVTTLTDLFISAVCFYAFYQISYKRDKNRLNNFSRFFFLSMGLATLIGGVVGHGFLYAFKYTNLDLPVSPWKLPGWFVSMLSIALIERASIEYASSLVKPSVTSTFKWINIIELITFMIITFTTMDFFFVEAHSAYGLVIVVTSFQTYVYLKRKTQASKLMLIGVGFSSLSAIIFMNEIAISKWFNHFDISHVFMTISAWYLYRGAMKMEYMNE